MIDLVGDELADLLEAVFLDLLFGHMDLREGIEVSCPHFGKDSLHGVRTFAVRQVLKELRELLADRTLIAAEVLKRFVTVFAERHPVIIQGVTMLLALEEILAVLVLDETEDESFDPQIEQVVIRSPFGHQRELLTLHTRL